MRGGLRGWECGVLKCKEGGRGYDFELQSLALRLSRFIAKKRQRYCYAYADVRIGTGSWARKKDVGEVTNRSTPKEGNTSLYLRG